jgi:hypothetical protein
MSRGFMVWRTSVLICIALAVLACVFSFGRIPQDPAYHLFADGRSIYGIPNFYNVLSNAPFLFAGIWGAMRTVSRRGTAFRRKYELWPYLFFFIGIALTSLGSFYYHWAPENKTLVWDRMAMAVAFMSLFAGAIGDRIGGRAGAICLFPMIIFGIFSVLYWSFTESSGSGDLRPYVIVQFCTIAAIPLLLILFPARYSHSGWLIAAGLAYLIAKVFEDLDQIVFGLVKISGHTLKHLVASIAAFCIIQMIERRKVFDQAIGPSSL